MEIISLPILVKWLRASELLSAVMITLMLEGKHLGSQKAMLDSFPVSGSLKFSIP